VTFLAFSFLFLLVFAAVDLWVYFILFINFLILYEYWNSVFICLVAEKTQEIVLLKFNNVCLLLLAQDTKNPL